MATSSYKLGQLRRPQIKISEYRHQIFNGTKKYEVTQNKLNAFTTFHDTYFPFTEQDGPSYEGATLGKLSAGKTYFLRFSVPTRNEDAQQIITLNLYNTKQDENNQLLKDSLQKIKTYVIPPKTSKTPASYNFEVVFTPNADYDSLLFLLERVGIDYTSEDKYTKDGQEITVTGRVPKVQLIELSEVTDLFPILKKTYGGLSTIKKLGVQGAPGMLMFINGEQIRIGRTGVYEIFNGYEVYSIGFVIKESPFIDDHYEYFIMDFEY